MLFSSKIIRYLTVAFLVVPVAGDVVEYLCCDEQESCIEGELSGKCMYFYADPFPDSIAEIKLLCDSNENDNMKHTCFDDSKIQGDKVKADYQCCDEGIACNDDCTFYYGRGPIAKLETACADFTLIPPPPGNPGNPPGPPPSTTCLVIVAAFAGQDPHFKTWGGEWYDFHGMCDLVMLDVPDFGNGQGLTIHTRTKGRYDYSYIESAAIKIGDNVFQLSSYGDYILDGVSQAELPATIGGYTIRQTAQNAKESKFEIQFSEHKSIELSTFKDLVNVRTPVLNHDEFRTSKGLFGAFPSGKLVGRDGTTVFTDHNEFGQEWQVLDSEAKLFQDADHFPQHPHDKCVLPDPTKDSRRRLGETVAREAAESACNHWGDLKEMCIMDVMATGDIEMAQSNHEMLM